MHIGVDATCWRNRRGYGRHARALLEAMVRAPEEHRYTFVVDFPDGKLPPGVTIRRVEAATPSAEAASAAGRRSLPDLLKIGRALSDPAFDVVLFPTVYSFVPVWTRARKVVMIHDVIAEVHPELVLGGARARLLWRAKVALGRRQADALVTVSDYSRRRIVEEFGIGEEDVFVVGEAADPIFRPIRNPEPTPGLHEAGVVGERRRIVWVGGFGPHKNVAGLIEVVASLGAEPRFRDVELVLVGDTETEVFHGQADELIRAVAEAGLEDRVRFTGFLPDDDLVVLLNLASVLALPSLMEGFGLPAVEAAACGCPVVATRESPLPGLLGEAGLYVDPRDPEDLRRALAAVLDSQELRRQMGRAGIAAAAALTWDAAAGQLLEVFEATVRA